MAYKIFMSFGSFYNILKLLNAEYAFDVGGSKRGSNKNKIF